MNSTDNFNRYSTLLIWTDDLNSRSQQRIQQIICTFDIARIPLHVFLDTWSQKMNSTDSPVPLHCSCKQSGTFALFLQTVRAFALLLQTVRYLYMALASSPVPLHCFCRQSGTFILLLQTIRYLYIALADSPVPLHCFCYLLHCFCRQFGTFTWLLEIVRYLCIVLAE